MKSEDGTGSRHALWVLKSDGIVTPPISFVLSDKDGFDHPCFFILKGNENLTTYNLERRY